MYCGTTVEPNGSSMTAPTLHTRVTRRGGRKKTKSATTKILLIDERRLEVYSYNNGVFVVVNEW
jgi:hypothetical protein